MMIRMIDKPTLTSGEIAKRIGGVLHGDDRITIRAVATLDEADPESLTWVGSPRFLPQAAKTKAGVVLIPTASDVSLDRTTIRVDDPDLALCDVLKLFVYPQDVIAPGVHRSAVIGQGAVVDGAAIGPNVFVGESAVIGPGTTLYPGVFVGTGTRMGRDGTLWPQVVLREHITLGDRVIIHANSTIGVEGFSFLKRDGKNIRVPQAGTVIIEDDVEIGANSAVDRARSGATVIGRGTKIDNFVQIAHNCQVGEYSLIAAQTGLAGSVEIGRHAVLAGRVGVVDHVTIGDGAQIGVGAIAYKDVPAGAVVLGSPTRDHYRFLREQLSLAKLPDLLRTVKKLESRIAELEKK